MTHRERVIAVLEGQKPEIIPCLGEVPMDVTVTRKLISNGTGYIVEDQIRNARFFGNSACEVGIELKQETLERDGNKHIYRYETGAVWHESYDPTFCREALSFEINNPEDTFKFRMPEVDSGGRFDRDELIQRVKAFHDAGYFVQGSVMGAWYGIYYYLTKFDNILMCMTCEPEAAHKLFNMTGGFSLESAKILLECGVDSIFTPSDHNDLEYFKKHWGKKITFHGGISTTISEMSEEQMRKHVKEVVETGRKGGRFIPRTESGIPPMPVEKVLLYLDILKEERRRGYL